ncbi:MAG: cyclic nucleotide-binding domain-containing protein [Saprospiraceae bacterium]|nr:cyclic nucleotide-binding domain-containing protein [Saprospiraceae bacterium]
MIKDVVYEAGQYLKRLYFGASGGVKSNQINDFGKEFTTHIYSKGDFFGFIPLLKGEKYP